jgi:hypothetical protein
MKYKVRHLINDTWEVIVITQHLINDTWEFILITQQYTEIEEEKVYQGSLADCEAYIRLKEGGYM